MRPAVSNGRVSARSAIVCVAVLAILMTAACGAFAAEPTACDGLVYKEGGRRAPRYCRAQGR